MTIVSGSANYARSDSLLNSVTDNLTYYVNESFPSTDKEWHLFYERKDDLRACEANPEEYAYILAGIDWLLLVKYAACIGDCFPFREIESGEKPCRRMPPVAKKVWHWYTARVNSVKDDEELSSDDPRWQILGNAVRFAPENSMFQDKLHKLIRFNLETVPADLLENLVESLPPHSSFIRCLSDLQRNDTQRIQAVARRRWHMAHSSDRPSLGSPVTPLTDDIVGLTALFLNFAGLHIPATFSIRIETRP